MTPADGEVLIVTAELIGGSLEVTAMLPGVSEADGTCTLEITGTDLSASVTGSAGNGVTYCGLMSVPPPTQAPAEWTFRVKYESSTTTAESAVSEVEAP